MNKGAFQNINHNDDNSNNSIHRRRQLLNEFARTITMIMTSFIPPENICFLFAQTITIIISTFIPGNFSPNNNYNFFFFFLFSFFTCQSDYFTPETTHRLQPHLGSRPRLAALTRLSLLLHYIGTPWHPVDKPKVIKGT